MKSPLKRKQLKQSNDDWWRVLSDLRTNPSKYLDLEAFEVKLAKTVEELKALNAEYPDGKLYYAWSSGKDSQSLRAVCELAGIKHSYIVTHELEFDKVRKYIEEDKPEGCVTVWLPDLNAKFVREHKDWVFPKNSKTVSKWNSVTQWKGHRKFIREYDADCIVLGRRKADGNAFPLGDDFNVKLGKKTYRTVCPLADYSHVEALYLIVRGNYSLSPIYDHPEGFRRGTHHIANVEYLESIEEGIAYLRQVEPNSYTRLKAILTEEN